MEVLGTKEHEIDEEKPRRMDVACFPCFAIAQGKAKIFTRIKSPLLAYVTREPGLSRRIITSSGYLADR